MAAESTTDLRLRPAGPTRTLHHQPRVYLVPMAYTMARLYSPYHSRAVLPCTIDMALAGHSDHMAWPQALRSGRASRSR